MSQMVKQLMLEESEDTKLEAIKNKYRALRLQAVGTWSHDEQRKYFAECERAYNQLLKYV